MNSKFGYASTVIFVLFLVLGIRIYATQSNQTLFYTINSLHTILPEKIWEIINLVTYRKYLILQILLLLITFLFKKEKLANVVLLIIAYFVVFAALKLAFGEARPYIALNPNTFYWLNMYEDATKSAYQSFPSGHVGNMAVFAFAISGMFFKRSQFWQFVMLLLVIITAITRICTGWHWPLDVIASGLIGYLLVKISLYLDLSKRNKINNY